MFRKMHQFHSLDFDTENHVPLYPEKHVFQGLADPGLSDDELHLTIPPTGGIIKSKEVHDL